MLGLGRVFLNFSAAGDNVGIQPKHICRSAASLLQGQAAQGRPVVLVRGLVSPAPEGRAGDLIRPLEHDMFR